MHMEMGKGQYKPHWQGQSFSEQGHDLYGQMDPSLDLRYDRGGQIERRASDGNKPVFPCSICGKEFSRPDYRRQHKESIHDKVTCRCVCGKVYTFSQNLQRHQKNCLMHLSMQH